MVQEAGLLPAAGGGLSSYYDRGGNSETFTVIYTAEYNKSSWMWRRWLQIQAKYGRGQVWTGIEDSLGGMKETYILLQMSAQQTPWIARR